MKQSKQNTTLCEKDALQDMYDAENALMAAYADAVAGGGSRPLRRQLYKLYGEQADTQFTLREQMTLRGYLDVPSAAEDAVKAQKYAFAKVKKQLG